MALGDSKELVAVKGYRQNRCRGCGMPCSTVYCAKCAEKVKCVHGNRVGECHACDVEGDFAFDMRRER